MNHALSDYPYSETVFENSPLNRVLAHGAPGADWQPTFDANGEPSFNGHSVKYDYRTNGTDDVRLFSVENGELVLNGFYTANELYKTVTKDENWTAGLLHTNEEFKDKQGQVVLKRSYVEDGSDADTDPDEVETYYVYDDFGFLRFVLPPEAMEQLYNADHAEEPSFKMITGDESTTGDPGVDNYMITKGGSLTLKPGFSFTASSGNSLTITTGNVSADLIYSYKYDGRKRMIEKKIPGAAPVYMVYDQRDRLVATQDGVMRENGEWLFTKYDALNRPVITGILFDPRSRDDLQTEVDLLTGINLYEEVDLANGIEGYTHRCFPASASANNYLSVIYYDDYNNLPRTSKFERTALIADYVDDDGTNNGYFDRVKGLVVCTRIKVLDGNELTTSAKWITTENYYDDRYRVIQANRDLYSANGGNIEIVNTKYDFVGKVFQTYVKQIFEGQANYVQYTNHYDHAGRLKKVEHSLNGAASVVLASMEYNELGELIKKTFHGETGSGIQELNYQYNIRGWLTQVNDPGAVPGGNQKFGMRLHYNDGVATLNGSAQYNGNISAMEWRTPENSDIGSPNALQAYGFGYDALNRLTDADYGEGSSFASNAGAYDVFIGGYDLNGNIGGLTRKKGGSSIDNLDYTYAGNQLLSVNDASDDNVGFTEKVSQTLEYDYDLNGNMVKDQNKGLEEVQYNHLNLPHKLIAGAEQIEYIYDAAGVKVAKKSPNNTMTYYAGNFVYEGSSLKYILHNEGMITMGSTPEYQYHIKDHLGNNRLTINSSGTIVDQAAYYPFGMLMTDKYNGGINNKYLYNGKELQDDVIAGGKLDWYDYGARFYDPSGVFFTTQDPMAESYYHLSPYGYCAGDPIKNIDVDGEWIWAAAGAVMDYGFQVYDNYKGSGELGYNEFVGNVNFASVALSTVNPGGKFKIAKTLVVEGVKAAVEYKPNSGVDVNTDAVEVTKKAVINTAVSVGSDKLNRISSDDALNQANKKVVLSNNKVTTAERRLAKKPNSSVKAGNLEKAKATAQQARNDQSRTQVLNSTIGQVDDNAVGQTINTINDRLQNEEEER